MVVLAKDEITDLLVLELRPEPVKDAAEVAA